MALSNSVVDRNIREFNHVLHNLIRLFYALAKLI
jgi:hypothetical protein